MRAGNRASRLPQPPDRRLVSGPPLPSSHTVVQSVDGCYYQQGDASDLGDAHGRLPPNDRTC